jgi:hypothetical protein
LGNGDCKGGKKGTLEIVALLIGSIFQPKQNSSRGNLIGIRHFGNAILSS